jgi:uncharacterized damage-inducible protein DinB
MLEQFQLLSRYNQWMNEKICNTSAQLSTAELAADRGAFFGSILGTLNHVMVAGILWLKRFADHPSHHTALNFIRTTDKPEALAQMLFSDFSTLTKKRKHLDATIVAWCNQLKTIDLNQPLGYHNMKGEHAVKPFASLILHFFNHQTHHRGQVTALLSQQGLDVGVTDLAALIPNG